ELSRGENPVEKRAAGSPLLVTGNVRVIEVVPVRVVVAAARSIADKLAAAVFQWKERRRVDDSERISQSDRCCFRGSPTRRLHGRPARGRHSDPAESS